MIMKSRWWWQLSRSSEGAHVKCRAVSLRRCSSGWRYVRSHLQTPEGAAGEHRARFLQCWPMRQKVCGLHACSRRMVFCCTVPTITRQRKVMQQFSSIQV